MKNKLALIVLIVISPFWFASKSEACVMFNHADDRGCNLLNSIFGSNPGTTASSFGGNVTVKDCKRKFKKFKRNLRETNGLGKRDPLPFDHKFTFKAALMNRISESSIDHSLNPKKNNMTATYNGRYPGMGTWVDLAGGGLDSDEAPHLDSDCSKFWKVVKIDRIYHSGLKKKCRRVEMMMAKQRYSYNVLYCEGEERLLADWAKIPFETLSDTAGCFNQ
jgi:hypothetical protein